MAKEYRLQPVEPLRRMMAWAVDIAVLAVFTILTAILVIFLRQAGFALLLVLLYAFLKAAFWPFSTTMGKHLMGLTIVYRTSGEPLSLLDMVRRQTLGKFLSWMILNLGVVWILIDRDNQGWHDKMVDSIVVEKDNLTAKSSTKIR